MAVTCCSCNYSCQVAHGRPPSHPAWQSQKGITTSMTTKQPPSASDGFDTSQALEVSIATPCKCALDFKDRLCLKAFGGKVHICTKCLYKAHQHDTVLGSSEQEFVESVQGFSCIQPSEPFSPFGHLRSLKHPKKPVFQANSLRPKPWLIWVSNRLSPFGCLPGPVWQRPIAFAKSTRSPVQVQLTPSARNSGACYFWILNGVGDGSRL